MLYGIYTEGFTEMATEPRKKGKGYEISVCVNGIRKSATRRTKAECRLWALEMEKDLRRGRSAEIADKTFAELLRNYGKLVSVNKRSYTREIKRIEAICRDPIAEVKLKDLDAPSFAEWRDRRLSQVSTASVIRDWNLLNHAINVSINEWEWLFENPLKKVKRPKPPQARTRLISDDEIKKLLYVLGYDRDKKPETITAMVGAALLFAIETAMRAGEIVSLTWDNIDLEKRTAFLPITKNGTARYVPLSGEAIRILKQIKSDGESVFNLNSAILDALFRKAKKRAMIDGLTFHDSRATAITRLSKKVDILTLARISGHRDLRILQVYYRESVEDIAKRI